MKGSAVYQSETPDEISKCMHVIWGLYNLGQITVILLASISASERWIQKVNNIPLK